MPTMDDEQEKGIFNGDTLEESLYKQMRTSFMAAVEGQDLPTAVERSIVQLYLGEINQNNVSDSFRQHMAKADGKRIVTVAMKDWKDKCKEELVTFTKQNKAHKESGPKLRDSWA